jgi:hypothetical protein
MREITEALFLDIAQMKLPKRMREQRTLMMRFLDCFNPMPHEHLEILIN